MNNDNIFLQFELDPYKDPHAYEYYRTLRMIYGKGFDLESLIFRSGMFHIFTVLNNSNVLDFEDLAKEIDEYIGESFTNKSQYYDKYGYN